MSAVVAAETALPPRRMTERQSFLIVGAAHVLLFAALSLALRSVTPPSPPADAVAVEIVSDAPAGAPPPPPPTVSPAPAPAATAPPPPAPQAAEPPKPAPEPEQVEPEVKPDPPPDKFKPEKVKPDKAKPDKPADKPKAKPLDTDALATLLDKRLPKPKSKPFDTAALSKSLDAAQPKTKALDTAALSKSLDAALPKGAPKASRGDPRAAAALAAAIRAQVTPCWTLPIGGTGKMTVLLHLDINRDGSVAGRPGVVSQTGMTGANGDYARAFAEAARRAVLRCSPLKLPAEQYDQWKAVEINFDPSAL